MSYVVTCGPIVLIVCPERFDETFTPSIARDFEPIFARGWPFAVVTETSRIGHMPDAIVRKQLAAWMTRPDVLERQAKLNVGSSTIVSNGAMRAMMTALYWLWTPPTPQHAARDLDEACTWSIAKLTACDARLVTDENALRARVRLAAPRPPAISAAP
jgi:hypothetical protein